jgi:CRP-like cAMP-binding protein
MTSTFSSIDAPRPFLAWQGILDWAQEHYRYRTFSKDERIPARTGLLYLVQQGVVRLVGASEVSSNKNTLPFGLSHQSADEAFLGFVGIGQPFEIVAPSPFTLDAYAHIDGTSVVWLYWNELDNWPLFRREVMESFRYQHQRKLLWLSTLGQKQTIDRLLGFLTLLIEEFGEPCDFGYCLPFPITHAQVGSAIGATRVTVTRLMCKLRQRKLIYVRDDRLICLPAHPQQNNSQFMNYEL